MPQPDRLTIRFTQPPRRIAFRDAPPVLEYTEAQLDAARREGHQRGLEEASRMLEKQLLEQRAEVVHLQSETFSSLAKQHAALVEQFRALVPELTMSAARRVLAGIEIDRDLVLRLVAEVLHEIAPSREAIEVALSARDLQLVEGNEAAFREKHPEILFRADAELQPGDCRVRSRFGIIDGRLETKLRSVEKCLQ